MIKTTNLKNTSVAWMPEIPSNWDLMRGKFLFKSRKVINDKMQCNDRLGLTLRGVIDRFEGDGVGLNPNDLRTYQIFNENELVFKLIDLENKNTSRVGFVHKRGIMSSAYIRVMNNANVNMRYFYYQYYNLYQRFIFNMIGQGVRATMSSSDLLNIPVAIPPLEVQNRIVAYLDKKNNKIDKFIRNKERLIELLEEEKLRIIKEKVTKGINLFASFKDTGEYWIGESPDHWKIKKLKRCCQVKRGASPRPIDDSSYFSENGEYSWVRILDVTASKKYLEYTEQKLSKKGVGHSVKMEYGDLFLSIAGSVGKPMISKIKCCIHDGFVWFRNLNELENEFLYYVFLSGQCFEGLGKIGTQLNLNTDTVSMISIPIPPLNEQLEIIREIINEEQKIDTAISKAQKEITSIKEYREALITELVTGKRSVPEPQRI